MLNRPFDDDYNVIPEPPHIEGEEPQTYTNFPSAEGFEKAPANWKPRAGRELPALRCTHVRDDDSRCKNFGVRGTGFNGTPAMCFIHGGSLPAVKAKAEATLLSAKMRLVENTGLALDTLFELTEVGTAPQIRLKAATEILDRAGIKGGVDINVEVTNNVSAAEEIKNKLARMNERMLASAAAKEEPAEDIVDAEEVIEAEESEEVTDE